MNAAQAAAIEDDQVRPVAQGLEVRLALATDPGMEMAAEDEEMTGLSSLPITMPLLQDDCLQRSWPCLWLVRSTS